MPNDAQHDSAGAATDMADHISQARQRAKHILGGEAHGGNVDDARLAFLRARDGVLLVWIVWVVFEGFEIEANVGTVLVAVGVGLSILHGLVAGLATRSQVLYYESELQRERDEIRTTPQHERAEVREMYAAKGFKPPLLDQVVDTICADDDRLLKVMMEEELGLFIHRVNHPVLVGLWNAGGALGGALALAVPGCLLDAQAARLWMPIGGVLLLALLAGLNGWSTRRVTPMLASWLIVGGVTGGLVHFLTRILAGEN